LQKGQKMGKGQAGTLEHIATAELIPYARNARTHSDQQVAQIAGSIQEFGFNAPVLIDAQNGIIAGHGRVMAASLLKLATVPCVRLSHLSDAQKRAYILADNRIALNSGWDEEMLANELQDLHADDIDLGLTGFDPGELSKMLGFDDAVKREEPVELKQLALQPPPPMTWVLIGIPTVRFGQINQQVEQIALLPEIICEVAANND
jgi:ParB-like chromosome segregation protein Spo0J